MYFILFCKFKEFSVDSDFIIEVMGCFDVLVNCLACDKLPITIMTPMVIVCIDERIDIFFIDNRQIVSN